MAGKAFIEIPTKPCGPAGSLPDNIQRTLHNEYAHRYLENISSIPSQKNMEFVLNNLPISQSVILPVWSRNMICIVPGMTLKEVESTSIMQEIFQTKAVTSGDHQDERAGHKMMLGSDEVSASSSQTPKLIARRTPKQRRISWCTVNTLEDFMNAELVEWLGLQEVQSRAFRKLLKPLAFADDAIYKPLAKFCATIEEFVPRMKDDLHGQHFQQICSILSSAAAIRLYGLLSHFCYWNIIHPCVRNSVANHLPSEVHVPSAGMHFSSHDIMESRSHHSTSDLISASASGDYALDDDDLLFENNDVTFSRENAFKPPAKPVVDETTRTEEQVDFLQSIYQSMKEKSHGMKIGSIVSCTSDASLTAKEKEALFVQLEECLLSVHNMMGFTKYSLMTTHQALVTCCHYVVDSILSSMYPWLKTTYLPPKPGQESPGYKPGDLGSVDKVRLQLRRLVHQALADLIDPSRIYSSTLLIKTMIGDHKPLSSVQGRRQHRSRFYKTSVVVRSVFGDTSNPEARRLMNLAGDDRAHIPIPGVAKPFGDSLPVLSPVNVDKNAAKGKISILQPTDAKAVRLKQSWADPLIADPKPRSYFFSEEQSSPFMSMMSSDKLGAPAEGILGAERTASRGLASTARSTTLSKMSSLEVRGLDKSSSSSRENKSQQQLNEVIAHSSGVGASSSSSLGGDAQAVLSRLEEVHSWRSRRPTDISAPRVLQSSRSPAVTIEAMNGLKRGISTPQLLQRRANAGAMESLGILDFENLFQVPQNASHGDKSSAGSRSGAGSGTGRGKSSGEASLSSNDLRDLLRAQAMAEKQARAATSSSLSPAGIEELQPRQRQLQRTPSRQQQQVSRGSTAASPMNSIHEGTHLTGGDLLTRLTKSRDDELLQQSVADNNSVQPSMLTTETRSMVGNRNAEVEISLKGKAKLMGFVIERTAEHYTSKNIMSQFARTPIANQRRDLLLNKRDKG